ncbi:uncharacterized protein NECHADRAFT_75759 [Fusarium vanettenii 77-13-4]|uniref:Zn(2)-C6 fungal-type domain-containing protein n=1 Tax=Fusarium vanettenii (strain ATCC MYA-4622 / CBS 123669 / FGSC 9596 / NRRL 45880 / 77-13-4) TaxID=660122 RepID=C7YJQ3_FUSV7|nr:uncharacterized protein NECHADRAFT_75759 [Fusarium vanettenii 77-13-4]EEU48314.1 hypothetical protein NECHADRAFT_75759 [Fusarium vanettenii 77-13-4]
MSEFRPRRTHKKSRGECRQCKSRHVKCDELDPGSRANTVASSPALLHARDRHMFSLEHMSLLFNITSNPAGFIKCDEPSGAVISDIIECALKNQYVMDQLLALSALQSSLQHPENSANLRLLSIQLQGRALSLHNASAAGLSASGMLPRFMFSMLLAYSLLHDSLSSSQLGMSTFIEKLGDFLQLIQLGKVMATDYWSILQASEIRHIYVASGLDPKHSQSVSPEAEDDLKAVESMLTQASAEQASLSSCRNAVTALKIAHSLYQKHRQHKGLRTQAHAAFLVYTPLGFVDALREKQPEALVILAHYGILLSKCCDFWVVGDAGRRLIRLVESTLGPEWDRYMELPKQIALEQPNSS